MERKVLIGATNFGENCAQGKALLEACGFEVEIFAYDLYPNPEKSKS